MNDLIGRKLKIIYDDENLNGIGKVYDYHYHVKFEGRLKNGKNGQGKEFDYYGNLIFEGIYLYDHRRKGKEYIKGKLVYEGEYLFDKKWKGKKYDNDSKIIQEYNDDK